MPDLDRTPGSNSEREAIVLRRAMRDLLALCTIPAAWVGREPDAIAKGVVDVLVSALRVECGYLMLLGDPAKIEVMQGTVPPGVMEDLLLEFSEELPRAPVVHELRNSCRAAIVPITVASRPGMVAAISSRMDFPTETESMLISVAANQAAVSLEEAHLLQDRIRAERALEESAKREAQLRAEADLERHRLKELMAHAPAAIALMHGPEHRFTYVNDYYVRVTGRNSPADFLGKTLHQSLPEMETPVFLQLLDDVYRTGTPYVGREMLATLNRTEQSSEAYFDFVYQPTRNTAGEVEGILVHAVEVTDKVLARKAITESEERLRLAQSAARIGTWEWDAVNDKRSLSPELHRIFATDASDPGHADIWAERVHPEDWEQVQRLMNEGYRQGEMEFEYRYQGPDVGTRWFYCKGRRSEGETRMLGVVQDVTERKMADETVRESEEELRILQRIGGTLASQLEVKKLVQAATDAGRELSQAEFGAFFYNDTDAAGEKYLLYTLSGAPLEAFSRFPMPGNTAVFAATFSGEGTVRVADIRQDPRYGKNPPYHGMPPGHLPVRSYLAVPVVSRSGEVIGGLFYGHSKAGIFTERAERLVEGIAAQAAIAIDNARLFETAQRERARAEESEARLRAIIETTPECVKLVAADGTLLDMNSVGLSLVGADCLNDVVGKNIYDVIAPEDRERFQEFNEKVCRGEQGTLEFDIVGLKGVRRHMQTHAAPLRPKNDQTIQLAVTRDVTERKFAEQALRESEQKLRVVTEATPILLWMAGMDKLCFYFNKSWLNFVGRTLEQEMGNGWAENVHPDDFDRCLQIYVTCFDAQQPFEMEYRLRHHSGQYRWILDHGVPRYAPDGRFEGFVGGCLDIHDQKEAAEKVRFAADILRESEERLRLAQQVAAIGTFEWNLLDNVNRWTPELEVIYGLSPGGFSQTQEAWEELVHPADRARAIEQVKLGFLTGAPVQGEWRVIWPDGSLHWILGRWQVFKDESGKPVRMTGINIDITSRKEAEEARRRLAAIVESSDDAIVSKDLNGIVTSWNPCAERIFGYTAEEMIGKPITTIIPPELHEDERRILATIARGERIEHFETVRMKKNGERIDVSLTISPVKDEQGRVIGAAKIARDITQRKRTERALQMTEKLASVGRLAATVAHELNNPLEAVTNFIFLAQTTEQLPEIAKEYLTLADRELERVSHIAQQTLGFYRDTSAPTFVDIRASLDDVFRVFESKLRYKSLKTDINVERGLTIEASGGDVRQVFSNLISNAIDASPTAAVVKVHAKTVLKYGQPYAQITFADSGCGIPDSLKVSIFNPFFTTKSDVGTGLGLWVSKSLVEKHHGHIAFRSKPGKGTAFFVQFPLRASSQPKEHARADV